MFGSLSILTSCPIYRDHYKDNTAAPNPGKDPKKDKKIQPSRWDKVTDEIKKSLSNDSTEFKELEINLSKLKARGLNPEIVSKLHGQGILPTQLDRLLEETRDLTKLKKEKYRSLDKAISPEFQEIAELTSKFLEMSKQPNIAKKLEEVKDFIQYAVADRQIYKFAKEIINSGKLRNVDELGKIVKGYAKQPDISGALGYQFEAEFAAQLVRSGHEISLGNGADVVNHTNKQAWQLKNVHEGDSFNGVLNKAALQLTGKNGEQPLLGYLKGIKVRVTNQGSPEYLKSPKQLEESIKKATSRLRLK
jgi:hypothetical protein